MPNNESKKKENSWYLRMVVKGLFGLLVIIAIIFLLAGRITYWQGWVYGVTSILIVVIQSIAFANKTDFAKERVKIGPGTKRWDKIFLAFYNPLNFAIIIIASLDAGRFGWTTQLPLFVYTIGYVVYVLSNFINLWAMWVNRFFFYTVRIQKGQKVVQNGPYRFIRHPGYVGGILLGIGTALVLGSLWALIPAGIIVILLIIRTYLEDTTLQKELPGYAGYAKKVKYRLLPRIW